MIEVVFLGYGNLNHHLCRALSKAENVKVKRAFNRNHTRLPYPLGNIPFTDRVSELTDADVYIIGIPDDAISVFSKNLPFRDKLCVLTSGGVAMDVLDHVQGVVGDTDGERDDDAGSIVASVGCSGGRGDARSWDRAGHVRGRAREDP